MSELIQMRQRIKAVETIKKVTHAMRLISMASHSKMRAQRSMVENYRQEISRLLALISQEHPTWNYPLKGNPESNRDLAIVVGSQKGLCGNFNNAIVAFFARQYEHVDPKNVDTIVIGKKAVELLSKREGPTVMELRVFNSATIAHIIQKISMYLSAHGNDYRSIIIYYQYPKTFFAQKPTALNLAQPYNKQLDEPKPQEAYRFEADSQELLSYLSAKQMEITLREILVNSLIAEQAARFIAMDSSTRNASNILDTMRLDYNKLRQAKITRELTDLTASF
ncbi:F0F1 ATP synthase subunit gamma [Candidatus Dependentiae bacterium]|nr:F0F1 ATP synthase subunit gamma [Candidatus Dependentiae bacterium]